MKHYRALGEHLTQKYGEKVVKICIDGGFTCPNRDGRCGVGGCIYCGELASGENLYTTGSISGQVRAFLDDERLHPKANKFIAYFQTFTNTYAPPESLKARYDVALIDDRIAVLSVGTRPDCIDEETAALLASYKDRVDVWVELGLQTASDDTARLINRGYPTARFTEAVALLRRYGLDVITHMIIGLPGETPDDVRNTVAFLNRHALSGVKLHSLYVMEGTALADMYRCGAYTPLTEDEYVHLAADALARLNPEFVIHRVTGDCRRDLLVAPAWNVHKIRVIRKLDRMMEQNNWHQGCLME